MTSRTKLLVRASAFASRYTLRDPLRSVIQEVKQSGEVLRSELYECFLQLYLFAGFPAGLEAMRALSKIWPEHDELANDKAVRETMSYPMFLERGQKLYQEIYSKNAETVRNEMMKLSPELAAWAVIEGYGKTLSRPGLDVETRELAIVAILTQLGWERQLYSHILGATNVGASREDVSLAIEFGAMADQEKSSKAHDLLARV